MDHIRTLKYGLPIMDTCGAQIASPYVHAHKGPMWGPDTKLIKDPYGSHTDKPI